MATRSLVTPPVHTVGVYSVITPFTVTANGIYTCYAIRSIDELVNKGIDVYADYYEANGLSESIYKEDVLLNASIITLISSLQEYVYVPNTYIESYPGMSGIAYSRKCILLDLGPLPDSLDVTFLLDDLQAVVKEVAGVEEDQSSIRLATIPMSTSITHEEHIQLEATRTATLATYTSTAVLLAEQTARADELAAQNDLLLEMLAEYPELTS